MLPMDRTDESRYRRSSLLQLASLNEELLPVLRLSYIASSGKLDDIP